MRFLRPAGLVLLAGAVGALMVGVTSPYVPGAGYYGAIAGLLVGLSMLGYRALARRLGRLTAVAAMCCLGAVILGGSALLASSCPGGGAERCDSFEVGTWILVGILIPFVWALFLLPPAAMARGARHLWRRKQAKKVTHEAAVVEVRQERQVSAGKAAAQRRARKAQRQARRVQRS